MYENEEVSEKDAKLFAKVNIELKKEIGAIFKQTSAKKCTGIDVLYYSLIL